MGRERLMAQQRRRVEEYRRRKAKEKSKPKDKAIQPEPPTGDNLRSLVQIPMNPQTSRPQPEPVTGDNLRGQLAVTAQQPRPVVSQPAPQPAVTRPVTPQPPAVVKPVVQQPNRQEPERPTGSGISGNFMPSNPPNPRQPTQSNSSPKPKAPTFSNEAERRAYISTLKSLEEYTSFIEAEAANGRNKPEPVDLSKVVSDAVMAQLSKLSPDKIISYLNKELLQPAKKGDVMYVRGSKYVHNGNSFVLQ